MTIAIVLGLGISTFAQGGFYYSQEENTEVSGLFGLGIGLFNNRNGGIVPSLPDFNSDEDTDAPLGSGIAVLMGLGAAYRQFAAAQICRYTEDYDFKPKSDIYVYKGADAEAFLGMLKELKPEG